MDGPSRPGSPLAAGLWPPDRPAAAPAALLFLGLALGVLGCGHANAPCPTPPATLDAHRAQSESLQRDLAQASQEAESLEARRQEAARRIQGAKAAEDSLASSAPAPAKARRK